MSSLTFGHVVDLLESLEDLAHSNKPSNGHDQRHKEDTILRTWFTEHQLLIHASDGSRIALLSTLLPGRRTDRVYGLGTGRLSHIFARCLRLGHARASQMYNWDQSGDEDFASLVCRLQEATEAGTPVVDPTLEEVDQVMHVLASRFHFSSPQIRQSASTLSADEILASLCCRMKAKQLKWLVRLMLKNLSPVVLEDWKIFRIFHPLLPGVIQLQAHFSAAISALRAIEESGITKDKAVHVLGQQLVQKLVGIGRPGNMVPLQSYAKARSTKHCLQLINGAKGKWSIETKHDGEYCQVHVDLSKGDYKCFQIFSKSHKDSTKDKIGVRGFLRDCLRIGRIDCGIQRNCILEGELLVYNYAFRQD
jgi:DNA ligase-4